MEPVRRLRFCRTGQPDAGDAPGILGVSHLAREGVADFFKAGKIPQVGKVPAWLRFHRLYGAKRRISSSAKRTCPGQRQQAVQR